MSELRYNVFGRVLAIRRDDTGWEVLLVGADGKRGPAGIVIPDDIEEPEIEQYLFDLFHESATPGHGDVRRLP